MRRWVIITLDVQGKVVDRRGPLLFRRNADRQAARTNEQANNSTLLAIARYYGITRPPWHAHVEHVTVVTPPLTRRGHRVGLRP